MRKISLLLALFFTVGAARLSLKVRHPKKFEQATNMFLVWIATDGTPSGLGTYANPMDYATTATFTNFYRARKDGCYSDGQCWTNPYAPPIFTNHPVADFPHFYNVEKIP